MLADMEMLYSMADPASFTAGWVEGNANFTAGRDYSLVTWNSVLLYATIRKLRQWPAISASSCFLCPMTTSRNPRAS